MGVEDVELPVVLEVRGVGTARADVEVERRLPRAAGTVQAEQEESALGIANDEGRVRHRCAEWPAFPVCRRKAISCLSFLGAKVLAHHHKTCLLWDLLAFARVIHVVFFIMGIQEWERVLDGMNIEPTQVNRGLALSTRSISAKVSNGIASFIFNIFSLSIALFLYATPIA